MDKNKSNHSKKKRITHIGKALDGENKDNSNDILESIFSEMSSSIKLAHDNINERREAHKIEIETKSKETSKCKINFLVPKKFPLMEKCQKTFKQVKHNRSVPKPRAHLAADFPIEELVKKSSKSLLSKNELKQSAKVKAKKVISESSSNLLSTRQLQESSKQKDSAVATKVKAKSSFTISKKSIPSNIKETGYDRTTKIVDKNAKAKKSSCANIKFSNVKADTSIKNISMKSSNAKITSKNATADSSDSDQFESFLKNYKIPKKSAKKKENMKSGIEDKLKEKTKNTHSNTKSLNLKKTEFSKKLSFEQNDSSKNYSSDDEIENEQINKNNMLTNAAKVCKKSETLRLKQSDAINSLSTEKVMKGKQLKKTNPKKSGSTSCNLKKRAKISKNASFKYQDNLDSNDSTDDSGENECTQEEKNYSDGNATCKSKKKSKRYKRVLFRSNQSDSDSDLDLADNESECITRKKHKKPISSIKGKNKKTTKVCKKTLKNQLYDDNFDGDNNLVSSDDGTESVSLKIGSIVETEITKTDDILNANSQKEVTVAKRCYSLRSKRNSLDMANPLSADVESTVSNNCENINVPLNSLPVENELSAVNKLTSVDDAQMLSKSKDTDSMKLLDPTETNIEQKDSDEPDIEVIEVITLSSKNENCYNSVTHESMDNEPNPSCVNAPAVKEEIGKHDPVFTTRICEDTADVTQSDDDDVVLICEENAQNVKQEKVDDDIIFDYETKPTVPQNGLIESESERFNLKRKSGDALNVKNEHKKIPRITSENSFVRPIDTLINDPFLGNIARDAYTSTVKPFQELDLPDLIAVYKKEFNVYQTILTAEQNMEVGIKMVEAHQAGKLKTIREYIEKCKSSLLGEKAQYNEVKFEKTVVPSSSQSKDYKQSTSEPLKNIPIKVESNVKHAEVSPQSMFNHADVIVKKENHEHTDVMHIEVPTQLVVDHASIFVKEEVHDNPEDVKPELLLVGKKCIQCQKDAASACQRCAKVFFCSNKCGRQYWNDGHKNECGKNVM